LARCDAELAARRDELSVQRFPPETPGPIELQTNPSARNLADLEVPSAPATGGPRGAQQPVTGVGLDFISEAGRNTAVNAYTTLWTCSAASLGRTAKVHRADLSKWKKGSLPNASLKIKRIEEALKNNDKPTPAPKRSEDF
jgi:hypothetical protein